MEKMGNWKYSPDKITLQIPSVLMDKIKPRWEFAKKIAKDIYEKTLRQCMPSVTDKEVKESIKRNEEKLTLKFDTCLVLMKYIEHVVKNAKNTWKRVYLLRKMDDSSVTVSEKDDDDEKEKNDREENDEETTHFDNIDNEEEHEQEDSEEDTQDIEENDPIKIVAVVIASLPYSPRKVLTTSSMETASARFNTPSTTRQSIFAPIQLRTSFTEVPSTSSSELQTLPSSTVIKTSILDTTVLDTSIFALIGTPTSISTISEISIFTASPTISTIVSIPSTQEISARKVETKPQPSTKFLGKGKEKEENVDLDEEIMILNWVISKLTPNKMQTFGELLQKKAKEKRLRKERGKEFKIIKDAKNISAEAVGIEIDSS